MEFRRLAADLVEIPILAPFICKTVSISIFLLLYNIFFNRNIILLTKAWIASPESGVKMNVCRGKMDL